MTIEYGILVLALALVYGIVKQWLPDFPIDEKMLLTLVVYVLLKLGVVVVGVPAFRKLQAKFRAFFLG